MTSTPEAPLLDAISRIRVFPENHAEGGVRTVPLSIIDNTVIRFAITNAGWYYGYPGDDAGQLSPDLLAASLRKSLNAYPQWAGQLEWLPSEGQRQGRACITYGSPNDPGVELILARCSASLTSLVPDTKTRLESGVWAAENFPSTQLLVPTQLAMHYSPSAYLGRPSVCAQVTTFKCGGVGIALRIAHCLSDAATLIQFATHWGAIHRALIQYKPLPTVSPMFNPALLDQAASGDIHSVDPDPEAIRTSRSLPIIKHDRSALEPARSLSKDPSGTEPSTRVAHAMVYLSPAEVQRIFDDLSAQVPANSRVSRFDTMLAFVWRLIVRARGMGDDAGPAHMVVTVGLRARLAPPLPEGFIGSPIALSLVTLPAREVRESAARGAAAIRATVAQFTPATVGAFLHDVAHQADPQRFWRAFLSRPGAVFTCWRSLDVYALDFGSGARPPYMDAVMPSMDGKQHSVVTAWQDLDVYGVGFGGDVPPRYVDAFIPDMDGCIHVMAAGPHEGKWCGEPGSMPERHWYDEPVCLSLHLTPDVMAKLLHDPELRKYKTK
ncbi:transferase [Lenzites betulinus]|nr:transferase [Lenzites betulinus]